MLALLHSYSGDDGALALQYFTKAKAIADLLTTRHADSLKFGETDARYGIPRGNDDALHSKAADDLTHAHDPPTQAQHWYATLVLGSWVGVRRLFHRSLFLTASRLALPQDPSTDPKCLFTQVRYGGGVLSRLH